MSQPTLPGTLRETRRILLDGTPVDVVRRGEVLVAGDGREVAIADAVHLPPVTPSKIVCVHLNYRSRVEKDNDLLVGRREDVIRADGDSFKIAKRKILITQSVFMSKNLNTFL